jgi:hypothetical protein
MKKRRRRSKKKKKKGVNVIRIADFPEFWFHRNFCKSIVLNVQEKPL